MSRPLSDGPAIRMMRRRRRRALTYDDLPPEMKEAIQDYLRHTNASLRAMVKDYFEDKAATEREWGKIGTWDVGRVTDSVTNMTWMFASCKRFNQNLRAWDTSSVRIVPPNNFFGCEDWHPASRPSVRVGSFEAALKVAGPGLKAAND